MAWTDRIFYKALAAWCIGDDCEACASEVDEHLGFEIVASNYECLFDVVGSDHKPVIVTLTLRPIYTKRGTQSEKTFEDRPEVRYGRQNPRKRDGARPLEAVPEGYRISHGVGQDVIERALSPEAQKQFEELASQQSESRDLIVQEMKRVKDIIDQEKRESAVASTPGNTVGGTEIVINGVTRTAPPPPTRTPGAPVGEPKIATQKESRFSVSSSAAASYYSAVPVTSGGVEVMILNEGIPKGKKQKKKRKRRRMATLQRLARAERRTHA